MGNVYDLQIKYRAMKSIQTDYYLIKLSLLAHVKIHFIILPEKVGSNL